MISLVIFNKDKQELDSMDRYSHYLAAHLSEEKWQYNFFTDWNEFSGYMSDEQSADIVCVDITIEGSINLTKGIRKINKHAYIILVATVDISPMEYMRPEIMAGSLLIRKYSENQLHEVFDSAFKKYLAEFDSDDDKEDMYVLESREGRRLIPYSQIYYFEARDKKIVIGCATSELTCYDTISGLMDELPDYFIRCHRSFIINQKKIIKVVLNRNEIEMQNDIYIPVSRSYKSELRRLYSDNTRKMVQADENEDF